MEANSVGKKNDRLNRLIGILKIRGAVSIRELAQTLEVSEMTIRRDMKLLQQNKVVENVDGVMVYNPAHTLVETDKEYSLALEEERRNAEKAAIGAFAASLVAQDDMIIIDTGTTTVHIARNLPTNLHLSVLCYNINILMELRRKPNIQPLFAGGYYHANAQMFESKEGVEFISGIRVQKAFGFSGRRSLPVGRNLHQQLRDRDKTGDFALLAGKNSCSGFKQIWPGLRGLLLRYE